jgi:hypothetical protein
MVGDKWHTINGIHIVTYVFLDEVVIKHQFACASPAVGGFRERTQAYRSIFSVPKCLKEKKKDHHCSHVRAWIEKMSVTGGRLFERTVSSFHVVFFFNILKLKVSSSISVSRRPLTEPNNISQIHSLGLNHEQSSMLFGTTFLFSLLRKKVEEDVVQVVKSTAPFYAPSSIFFRMSGNSFQSYMMATALHCSLRVLAICSIFSLPSSRP